MLPLKSKSRRKSNKPKGQSDAFPRPKQVVQRVNLGVGFPRQLSVDCKYVDTFSLTSALGVMANYRFRANGMFDPNHTAAGHQPAYYDNLTAVYDKWVITRSRIDLVIMPTSDVTPCALGIAINDDTTTTLTSFSAYSEANFVNMIYTSALNAAPKRVSQTWNASLVFPGDPIDNPQLWGTTTNDPGAEQIFNVFCQAVDQVSSAGFLVVATITYEAIFFELKDLTTS